MSIGQALQSFVGGPFPANWKLVVFCVGTLDLMWHGVFQVPFSITKIQVESCSSSYAMAQFSDCFCSAIVLEEYCLANEARV